MSVRAQAVSGNGTTPKEFDFDLFCIGAGSGGVRASRVAAGTYGAWRRLQCCLLRLKQAHPRHVLLTPAQGARRRPPRPPAAHASPILVALPRAVLLPSCRRQGGHLRDALQHHRLRLRRRRGRHLRAARLRAQEAVCVCGRVPGVLLRRSGLWVGCGCWLAGLLVVGAAAGTPPWESYSPGTPRQGVLGLARELRMA